MILGTYKCTYILAWPLECSHPCLILTDISQSNDFVNFLQLGQFLSPAVSNASRMHTSYHDLLSAVIHNCPWHIVQSPLGMLHCLTCQYNYRSFLGQVLEVLWGSGEWYDTLVIHHGPLFSDILCKSTCCGYSFKLHQQVDAIQAGTHNIHVCLYKEVDKSTLAVIWKNTDSKQHQIG